MKLLSVIIPCYNESKCLKHNIEDIVIPYFNNLNIDYEIILVNDGSSDNTKEIMKEIKGVISVSYDDNHGKGYAIRQGILASKGEYILFMDTDLSTDLSAVHAVLDNINKYDFIIPIPGSRKIERLKSNFEAGNVELSEEEIKVIDDKLNSMEFKVFGGH